MPFLIVKLLMLLAVLSIANYLLQITSHKGVFRIVTDQPAGPRNEAVLTGWSGHGQLISLLRPYDKGLSLSVIIQSLTLLAVKRSGQSVCSNICTIVTLS